MELAQNSLHEDTLKLTVKLDNFERQRESSRVHSHSFRVAPNAMCHSKTAIRLSNSPSCAFFLSLSLSHSEVDRWGFNAFPEVVGQPSVSALIRHLSRHAQCLRLATMRSPNSTSGGDAR
eukprot:Opistho-1_new@78095